MSWKQTKSCTNHQKSPPKNNFHFIRKMLHTYRSHEIIIKSQKDMGHMTKKGKKEKRKTNLYLVQTVDTPDGTVK